MFIIIKYPEGVSFALLIKNTAISSTSNESPITNTPKLQRNFKSAATRAKHELTNQRINKLTRRKTPLFSKFDQLEERSLSEKVYIEYTSSGSTGEPKNLRQEWAEFKSKLGRSNELKGLLWGTCFSPNSYAGMQVAAQAWISEGSVFFYKPDNFHNLAELLVIDEILALSVTPTWLRSFSIAVTQDYQNSSISRITLGGEPVQKRDVELAQRYFPKCKVTVIYAAGDFGIVFLSKDYSGTFTKKDLDLKWASFEVANGELVLNPSDSNKNPVKTGDLAEIDSDGGVRIIGRKSRVANVGGHKISLDKVEDCINSLTGVELVQCRAVENPITGQIIKCHWVGNAKEEVIAEHCRQKLSKPAVPKLFEFGGIEISNGGKKAL